MNEANHALESKVAALEAALARMGPGAGLLARARRRQRGWLALGSLGMCLLPCLGWAAIELTVFERDTPIVAADVNANFDALAEAVTDLDAMLPRGTILGYAGPTPPPGWLACDGSEVDRASYDGLFTAIGTTYGPGDDVTTFNLPDLRGRVAIGAGAADELSAREVGDVGGAETRTLGVAELPSHGHAIDDPGHAHSPSGAGNFITAGGANFAGIASGAGFNYINVTTTNATGITGTNNTGGGGAFSILPPFLAVQYIIKA